MPYTNRYGWFWESKFVIWIVCVSMQSISTNWVKHSECIRKPIQLCIRIYLYTCYIWCTGVTCCLGYHGCCGKCTTFLSLQSWFSCMIILLSGRTMTMMSIVDGLHAPRTVHTVARAAVVQISSWSIPILIHWRVACCRCSNHCSHMTLCE